MPELPDETDMDPRLVRVAQLTGVDPTRLDWTVEAEHGWEPHDKGYLHKVVTVAGEMLGVNS